MSDESKKRGGWTNPASADNGKRGGRAGFRFVAKTGETYIHEVSTIGGDIQKPQLARVISAAPGELELQIGDDIITLRHPDSDDPDTEYEHG